MSSAGRPLKVFLCHAHADRDPVRGLYSRLTKDGVDAWLDKEKLLPGQDWELEIRKAVREADVVVVCLSKQFNQAGFRQKEVRLALDTAMEQPEGEIFLIPARLEECDTPESLGKWHWVDLFDELGYEMLIRALRARATKTGRVLRSKKGSLDKARPSSVKKRNSYYVNNASGANLKPALTHSNSNNVLELRASNATRKSNLTIIILAIVVFVGAVVIASLFIEKWLSSAPNGGSGAQSPQIFIDILQLIVFSCVIPVMYLIILLFAFLIIRGSPTVEMRVRSVVAVFGGILFALAFVIIDTTATGFANLSVDPTNIFVIVPFGIVSAVIGFFVLFATDIFLRRGAAALVVFFIVWISLISAYFLVRASELRGVISLSTVSFLFGNIIYILANFSFVNRFMQSMNPIGDEKKE